MRTRSNISAGEHLLARLEVALDDGVHSEALRDCVESLADGLEDIHRDASVFDTRGLH